MARKPRPYRPEPIPVGTLRVRVVRGPHGDDIAAGVAPEDARWYWRIFRGETVIESPFWATAAEAKRRAAGHVTTGVDEAPASAVVGTFGAVVAAFLADREKRRDIAVNTLRNDRRNLGHVRDGSLGSVKVRDVNEDTVRAYVNERIDGGTAASTIRAELTAARAAWRWGHDGRRSLTPRAPWPSVKVEDMPERERDKYTPPDADVEATINALDGWQRMALWLMFATGMRLHEIGWMTWPRVDLRAGKGTGCIHVDPRCKTGEREVRIDRDEVRGLREWRERPPVSAEAAEAGFVLGVTAGTVEGQLGRQIAAACEAAGVRPFTPHGVRRAVVRRFRRAGVSVKVAAAHFGHSAAVMLALYDEVDETDRTDALALLRAFRAQESAPKSATAAPASATVGDA